MIKSQQENLKGCSHQILPRALRPFVMPLIYQFTLKCFMPSAQGLYMVGHNCGLWFSLFPLSYKDCMVWRPRSHSFVLPKKDDRIFIPRASLTQLNYFFADNPASSYICTCLWCVSKSLI